MQNVKKNVILKGTITSLKSVFSTKHSLEKFQATYVSGLNVFVFPNPTPTSCYRSLIISSLKGSCSFPFINVILSNK